MQVFVEILIAIKRLKKEYDEIERDLAELPFTVYPLEVRTIKFPHLKPVG